MTQKCIGIAAGLFATVLGLQAQGFEISPFYGYRFGGRVTTSDGQDSELEAGPAYGLSLNYVQRDSDLKLAVFWSHQDSGLDLDGAGGLNHVDMSVDEFRIGGFYEYGQGRLHETVTALVGVADFLAVHDDQAVLHRPEHLLLPEQEHPFHRRRIHLRQHPLEGRAQKQLLLNGAGEVTANSGAIPVGWRVSRAWR